MFNKFDLEKMIAQTKELKESTAVKAIHFWVGAECDPSVSGAAALRAAELDSQITSATILLREAQGRESPRFLAYFRQRLINIDSPNKNDIAPIVPCTLHRVGGTGIPILTELQPVDWCCLSSRHVFIIDVPSRWPCLFFNAFNKRNLIQILCTLTENFFRSVIFLWLGSNSEPLHKSHALKILEEHNKNANDKESHVFIVEDGYEKTLQIEARKLFDEILDPSKRFVSPEPLVQVIKVTFSH